jgi:cation-transporting P-type ATPase 13A2
MASPPGHGEYDYTEGASPYEITRALSEPEFQPRPRRDSQVGSVYDEAEGKPSPAIYDGYVAGTIPSSITSMHHDRVILWNHERRASSKHRRPSISRAEYSGISSSRRRSTEDSDVALADDDEEESQYNEDGPDDVGRGSTRDGPSRPRTRLRRKTSERPPSRNTVLDSIAGIFSRPSHAPESPMGRSESMSRRSSVSHGSTRLPRMRRSMSSSSAGVIEHPLRDDNDEDEERWGYSSGEEGQLSPTELSNLSSGDDDLSLYDGIIVGPRPASPTTSLPILPRGNDSFFGDTRIDMSVELGFQELPKPPPGPPSRQSVYIVDEDMTVLFVGYEILSWRRWAWLAGCVVSFGALGFAGLWNPRLWLRWVAREVPFESLGELGSGEGIIMAEVRDGLYHVTVGDTQFIAIDAISGHLAAKDRYTQLSVFPVIYIPTCITIGASLRLQAC